MAIGLPWVHALLAEQSATAQSQPGEGHGLRGGACRGLHRRATGPAISSSHRRSKAPQVQAQQDRPQQSPPAPASSSRVGTPPTIGNAPFIIAQQRGYFAEEGLEVELVSFSSGAEAVAPLGASQVDAANSINPSAGLINAIACGVTIKIVADNGSIKANRNIANILVRKSLAPAAGVLDLASLPRPIKAAAVAEGLVAHAIILREAERAGLQISE